MRTIVELMINHYSTDERAAERRAPEFALVDIKWGERVTVHPITERGRQTDSCLAFCSTLGLRTANPDTTRGLFLGTILGVS